MKTDKQLQQDVIAELNWEPAVNAAQIGVEVNNGIVTLAGHVNSLSEKFHAENAAQRVAGVQALTVEININLPGHSQRSDTDIAHTIEKVLQWTTYLPQDTIKIKVEKGVITLSGEVDWDYQRRAALDAVRYLMGVKGVNNHITLSTKKTMHTLKLDIENTLKRHSPFATSKVIVDVHGADVTLSGSVHSWAERDSARHTAWNTPGVHNVVDNIYITQP